jgi:hypothetical protein
MTERRWLTLYVAVTLMTFVLVLAWLLYANQPPPEHHFIPL